MTIERLRTQSNDGRLEVPVATAWLIGDLGEALGRQELFARQAPQRLKALREHAMIESAISSNRIEGVEIAPGRRGAVLVGRARLTDRDEAEVRGYRDALRLIHDGAARLDVSEQTIRKLHGLTRARVGDAGTYRDRDLDIIEKFPDGRSRVRFKAVPARALAGSMSRLTREWTDLELAQQVPPAIAAAAFNLDFLCIHPFRDGNGRVSRLLLLLQAYRWGCEVGRYMSLERIIEENKERYSETLEISSRGWHEDAHDPWPYVNFLLFVLKTAFAEFERRVGATAEPRGMKTSTVLDAVARLPLEFRVDDLRRLCPAVSLDMIRRVLKDEQKRGALECLGRGPLARWRTLSRG